MRSNIFLILPAFAAAAAAIQPLPRQTSSSSDPKASACLAAIESVGSSFPTIPRELVGMTDINPITDPCNYTPPAAMATAFSSFSTVLASWVSENWPKITSEVEKCPSISSDVDGFARAWDQIICTDKNSGDGGAAAATTTPTTTGGTGKVLPTTSATDSGSLTQPTQASSTAGSAGVNSTSTKSAGGARETGFVAGIVAAVGFVGAVVAL
ncbi:hypothetical protein B0H63DRAFT_137170 [Podospora didyma]|uniref:Infection structure specific protein n=1 Tax=Podospora didyma TaxID=330526 RepID=A0AAE0U0N8_9PEZI|nr:hypothetical protein B0H63DRAFT_137170 [Podospora didyma]